MALKRKKYQLAGILGVILFLPCLVYFVVAGIQESAQLTVEVQSEAPGDLIKLSKGVVHYSYQPHDPSRTILFIHGGGVTGMEVWKENLPYFSAKGYSVLAYDLYGRGYTDRVEGEQTPDLFAGQMKELIDSLGIKAPFDIVALSMGAIVALDHAANYPAEVNNIVLISPAATGDFIPNVLLKLPLITDFAMALYWYPKAVENQRKEFVDQNLFETYAKRLRYFMDFKGHKRINYSTWMNTLNQNRLANFSALSADKVLLIYGRMDPYFPEGNIPLYKKEYHTLKVSVVENAGHMPQYEKYGEVNKIIESFLKKGPVIY